MVIKCYTRRGYKSAKKILHIILITPHWDLSTFSDITFKMTPPNGNLGEKKAILEFFISEVQRHTSIWNKKSKDYKNVFVKSNSWNEILANVRSTFADEICVRFKMNSVEGLKGNWKNLRDTYSKTKKKAKGKSGAGLDDVQEKKEWPFFHTLQFLDQSDDYGKGVTGISSFMDAEGTNQTLKDSFS